MSRFYKVICTYCGLHEVLRKGLTHYELKNRKCDTCGQSSFRTKPLPDIGSNPFGYEEEKDESKHDLSELFKGMADYDDG